LPEGAVIVAG